MGALHRGRLSEGKRNSSTYGNFRKVLIRQLVDRDVSLQQRQQALDDGTILLGCHHPNVHALHGVVVQNNMPYLVAPLPEYGDLKDYLVNNRKVFKMAGEICILIIFCVS